MMRDRAGPGVWLVHKLHQASTAACCTVTAFQCLVLRLLLLFTVITTPFSFPTPLHHVNVTIYHSRSTEYCNLHVVFDTDYVLKIAPLRNTPPSFAEV